MPTNHVIHAVALACLVSASLGTRGAAQVVLVDAPPTGKVEHEVKSQYSTVRVRRNGNVRSMVFVRDSGEEAIQSQMDLENSHELVHWYAKYMFLSYAFRPKQSDVLIIGLGGGSMVRFLNHYDPEVHIDAVEIDQAVVDIAKDYFGVSDNETTTIVTEDGFEYLMRSESKYDVIYMDAFLKPSQETDATGVPLKLRTLRFYRNMTEKLKPGGLVAFNVNTHTGLREDLETIREAFAQIYVFPLPSRSGVVVLASTTRERLDKRSVILSARDVDNRFGTTFSFERLARRMSTR